ncbi:hypothetical protein H696_05522 [Fonticula alba]|uniref:PRKR-interacting protein 1 n=1 Tax=Fonticula alba TaxID=691883 RepID=A0A058Z3H5_FONAL|nr:hypothetical protein H696_05522 [Fonticula alba]KCV68057.1 hypothetical protein H696_05522 [Fonticula alba]|eukprot:XP_009497624.1 hypothetical protein H696_05522 [Fonticula alba]
MSDPYDAKRAELQRLMSKENPQLPASVYMSAEEARRRNASVRNPRVADFKIDVSGSSAGSGSGDFHTYRVERRRELERQAFVLHEAEEADRMARLAEQDSQWQREAEDRTNKNRQKRERQKRLRQQAKLAAGETAVASPGAGPEAPGPKRPRAEPEPSKSASPEPKPSKSASPEPKPSKSAGPEPSAAPCTAAVSASAETAPPSGPELPDKGEAPAVVEASPPSKQ